MLGLLESRKHVPSILNSFGKHLHLQGWTADPNNCRHQQVPQRQRHRLLFSRPSRAHDELTRKCTHWTHGIDVAKKDCILISWIMQLLMRMKSSYEAASHRSSSELVFPILFGHLCYASHACWTVFVQKALYQCTASYEKKFPTEAGNRYVAPPDSERISFKAHLQSFRSKLGLQLCQPQLQLVIFYFQ